MKALHSFKWTLLFCALAFCACRQTLDTINPRSTNNDTVTAYTTASNKYADIFETFWQAMKDNYVYWDIEPTGHWDSIHNTYKPQFAALGDFVSQSDESATAMQLFKDAVGKLHDGHLGIQFDSANVKGATGDNDVFQPLLTNVVDKRYTDPNQNPKDSFPLCDNTTVGADTVKAYGSNIKEGTYTLYDDSKFYAAYMEISIADSASDFISYLYLNQFMIQISIDSSPSIIWPVFDTFIKALQNANCKGVIVDVRGNGGGDSSDLNYLWGLMVTREFTFAHLRSKNGPGPLDYGPWVPFKIVPNKEFSAMANLEAPVVIICNDYSVSCAELSVMAVKALPGGRGHAVGTRTLGGTGPRFGETDPTLQVGGPFTHDKFWLKVTEAGLQTHGVNHENYEGVGVPPSTEVLFDKAEFNASPGGKDRQLEAAIKIIDPNHTFP